MSNNNSTSNSGSSSSSSVNSTTQTSTSTTTTTNWTPSQDALSQIVGLLQNSQSPNPETQRTIHQQLQSFNNIPDYFKYLVYIFTKLHNHGENLRMLAGLLLKNNIREQYHKMPEDVKSYIKGEILTCIGDSQPSIRKTVASIVTTIIVKSSLRGWPGLLQSLVQCLDSQDLNYVEGALNTFVLICEDYADKLDAEDPSVNVRPLNILIPKFLSFFQSPHPVLRRHAISCVNQFIVELPAALLVSMDTYLQGLFFLCNDSSSDVRKRVCQAFVTLVEVRIDYLLPYIRNVIQYMLHATQDKDEMVALEACEFWSAIAETQVCKEVLKEFIPLLVPLLLGKMSYTESDLLELGEDESQPDDPKDIRPWIGGSKTRGSGMGNPEDEESEDDDEWDEDYSEWNIRKCSAAGLDILSTVFQDDFLNVLLPLIQIRLNDKSNWVARESAILSLGAIAEGCSNGMKQHLPALVPYLVSLLNDTQALIRSITCWTLSRYSRWIVRQGEKLLRPLIFELLNRILDRNKKVQEAACSAFATLEEEAQADLVPYLGPILQCLMTAFGKYQAKNLLILYDAIGTLADSVGGELNTPENIQILMPPLINKWNSLSDEDRNLFPLLECLTSIAAALGVGFQNFALPVYQRCLRLIETTLIREAMAQRNQGEHPDKEFMICALDLVSGLADGLGPSIESLVGNSNLANLLLECMKDHRADVRQSAFALVGDLAKCCIVFLKAVLHEYIPLLANSLVLDFIPVCNNACWAVGEIAIKIGEEIKPFVPMLMSKLTPLIKKDNLNRNLLENSAITIGRLGFACPDLLAPHLEDFVRPWCLTLRNIRDDTEKDSAFRGLVKLINLNPNGVVKHFVFVCDAIASWDNLKQDLRESFFAILHGFKNSLGAQWPDFYKSFPPPLQRVLSERYQL